MKGEWKAVVSFRIDGLFVTVRVENIAGELVAEERGPITNVKALAERLLARAQSALSELAVSQ